MALYAINQYTADGNSDLYNITFDYLSRNFIKVYVDRVLDENVEFITDTQIKTSTVPPVGAEVTITRETPLDREVDFRNTSLLNSSTLNADSIQMLHIVQEAYDRLTNLMSINEMSGQYDAGNLRIENVGDAQQPSDAMNMKLAMQYLEDAEFAMATAIEKAQEVQTIKDNMIDALPMHNNDLHNRDFADKADFDIMRSDFEGFLQMANAQMIGKAIIFG